MLDMKKFVGFKNNIDQIPVKHKNRVASVARIGKMGGGQRASVLFTAFAACPGTHLVIE